MLEYKLMGTGRTVPKCPRGHQKPDGGCKLPKCVRTNDYTCCLVCTSKPEDGNCNSCGVVPEACTEVLVLDQPALVEVKEGEAHD
jgi:hypothetical protein